MEDFINYITNNNKELDVNKNNEKIIYESFICIKNYITSNELNNILNLGIFKFSLNKIIKINITANNLESIPDIFKSLINLKTLILNNNKITKIENLDFLSKLEKLELRGNKITKIDNLNNLKCLKKLTLSCNLISKIEENDLPEIAELTEFGLFGNYLGVENKEFDIKINEENIQQLKIIGNIIKKKFKNLKGLYIGGNYFTNLICNITIENKEENYKKIIKSILPDIIIDGQN